MNRILCTGRIVKGCIDWNIAPPVSLEDEDGVQLSAQEWAQRHEEQQELIDYMEWLADEEFNRRGGA